MADKNVGRPRKFESVEELERMIQEYFDSCWEESWHKERNEEGKMIWVQDFDQHNEPIMKMKEIPCITGLAKHLGTTRRTLIDYEEGNYDKDDRNFSHTIKNAKGVCEYYAEQGTLTGTIPAGAGVFVLKNYGWTDKQEIESKNENTNRNTNTDIPFMRTEDIEFELRAQRDAINKMLGE